MKRAHHFLSLIILFLSVPPAWSQVEVISGTQIKYKGEKLVISGYVTPGSWSEPMSQCRQNIETKAQSYLKNLLNDKTKDIKVVEKEKHDTFKVVSIFIDNQNLASIMIEENLACTAPSFCGYCFTLQCPEDEKYQNDSRKIESGGDIFRFETGKSF